MFSNKCITFCNHAFDIFKVTYVISAWQRVLRQKMCSRHLKVINFKMTFFNLFNVRKL